MTALRQWQTEKFNTWAIALVWGQCCAQIWQGGAFMLESHGCLWEAANGTEKGQ